MIDSSSVRKSLPSGGRRSPYDQPDQRMAGRLAMIGEIGRNLLDRVVLSPIVVSPRRGRAARILIRSTTPMKLASEPIGSCTTAGYRRSAGS